MSSKPMTIDDGLIRASQSGDKQAFARLLDIIYTLIYRFAFKWAGCAYDAEDITQQACIKLARVIKQFRFESAFTTWLYRIVMNCANDWSRKEQRQAYEYHEDLSCIAETNTDAVEAQSELAAVLHQVEGMGKDYKITLLLVYAEGLSHRQAAEILGVKESTVSWRLHDIRKRLSSATAKGTVNHEFDQCDGITQERSQ